MRIVCFGQQNWDYCWTGKQHLMSRLAERGHSVLYVDPDWSFGATTWRRALTAASPSGIGIGLRTSGKVQVYTYHCAPWLRWRRNVQRWNSGRVLGRVVRALRFEDAVAISLRPDNAALIDAISPSARVYYGIDECTGYNETDPAGNRALRRAEEDMLRRTDVALAISRRLLRRFETIQPRTYLLESAADPEHFSPARLARAHPHPSVAALPRPRIGMIGQIDGRLDQSLLAQVALAQPTWQFVLVGRVQSGTDISRLAALSNVHFTGYTPYETLPGVMRELDVAVLLYRRSLLTESCSPLKAYEYLAAGLPVVATPVEGLASIQSVVRIASTPDEFVQAIREALARPADGRADRLGVAAAHTWDERTTTLENRLREALEVARVHTDGAAPRSQRMRPPMNRRVRLGEALPLRSHLLLSSLRALGAFYYGARVAARAATGNRPAGVHRILVVRSRCYLGDLIAFLPTLAALKRKFPSAHITLATQPDFRMRALLDRSGVVDDVVVLDFLQCGGDTARLKALAALFLRGFDLVVSGASYFFQREPLYSGAPRLIGLDEGDPFQALNREVVPLDPTEHEADNNLSLVRALGIEVARGETAPQVWLDDSRVREAGDRVVDSLGVAAGAPVLLVHAGSKMHSRRWPAERFAELLTRLLTNRAEVWVVFSGVDDERDLVENIRDGIPEPLRSRTVSAAGATDLYGLAGLFTRSVGMVCNDTGAMHFARARGLPLVALMGPENHLRWGPYPEGAAPATVLRHVVPCAPCRRQSCDALYCLRSLTVDEVTAAVGEMLDYEKPSTPLTSHPTRALVHRHGWDGVAAAGFDLPLVSVVEISIGATRATNIDQAIAMLRDQTYPATELVVIDVGVGFGTELRREIRGGLAVAATAAPDRDQSAVWRRVLDAARGELIVHLPAGAWPARRLADAVAVLVRDPLAVAAGGADGTVPVEELTLPIPPGATFRRSALQRLLRVPERAGVVVAALEPVMTAAGQEAKPLTTGYSAALRNAASEERVTS